MSSVKKAIGTVGESTVGVAPLSLKNDKGSHSGVVDARLVSLLKPGSSGAESYSRLRLSVERMRRADQGLVVAVTSPGKGDGKTLTALNLAGALAQNDKSSVLLIELNLRADSRNVTSYLDLKTVRGHGVIDWIRNEKMAIADVTRYLPGFNLRLILAGGKVDLPYELLNSPRLELLLNEVRSRYDYIVVDVPHCTELPDIELVSRFVDGFLIVVKAGFTQRKLLAETFESLGNDKVIGVVFNDV